MEYIARVKSPGGDTASHRPAVGRKPPRAPSAPSLAISVDSPDGLLAAQRLIGNRAVSQFLGRQVQIAPHDHPAERQAEAAERHRVTGAADPAGVHLHLGPQVDRIVEDVGAEGFSYRHDIYLSSKHYRPGSAAGEQLLAHEISHATGPAATSGLVHLKPTKKRLDFIRIKKEPMRLVLRPPFFDGGGHWWVEAGNLPNRDDLSSWQPRQSWGWFPKEQPTGPAQLLGITAADKVEGQLNEGQAFDPNQGSPVKEEYHPAIQLDDKEPYDAVYNRVMGEVRSFAYGFQGSWNWRLGWGKNCHTFVDRMSQRLGFSQTKAPWLAGSGLKHVSFEQVEQVFDRADLSHHGPDWLGAGEGGRVFGELVARQVVTLDDFLALSSADRRRFVELIRPRRPADQAGKYNVTGVSYGPGVPMLDSLNASLFSEFKDRPFQESDEWLAVRPKRGPQHPGFGSRSLPASPPSGAEEEEEDEVDLLDWRLLDPAPRPSGAEAQNRRVDHPASPPRRAKLDSDIDDILNWTF
jgi:hypothetical protein